MRASKYLGVPPWELLEQPVYWLEVALAAESAETSAQSQSASRKKSAPGAKKG